ncbi:hypothetical protein DBV05_g11319 [Lasiodiplodia theobromae]|uniref:Btz domain-containing protein n=1 Tax=Lasiodiplodia theobromae TaxID=45133 RepID=A0A5N5CXI6_9PEZI|nr:hypothetical protein DBV05_g11319 [Lasiodiplodia theobromae]
MAPPRRAIVRRRRRDAEEATEDERGDSQSEASFLTDEDADADASDLSESESVATRNGVQRPPNGQAAAPPAPASAGPMTDTEAMMNGLKISHDADAVDFESLPAEPQAPDAPAQDAPDGTQPAPAKQETLAERRRREHEEYKKKRDEDPAFIPNRGAFFMHDHRSQGAGSNGFKPYGRGRGRGRGVVGGPYSPAGIMAREEAATSAPWTHDLHETLEEPAPHRQSNPPVDTSSNQPANDSQWSKPPAPNAKTPPVKSFSSTKLVGNARVRLFIPGMQAPIHFAGVPIKEYTKLPNHRPPLRRDKPVRISLPDQPPRYIFPATERSFIFIPRALRPNQQGFGRGRGRFGSYGGFSSRRTSSIMSRPPGGPVDNRPVVRLPPGSQPFPGSGPPSHPPSVQGGATPVVNMPPPPGAPMQQRPPFRESWGGPLPMHQPKPQKTVSVAGIESPANLAVHAPQQQEQQPFHQQVPQHVNGAPPPVYPSNVSTGTPLSNIPERGVQAQPFQTFQPGYAPQGFAPPTYYYPPPAGAPQYPAGAVVPMYMPNPQQGAYAVPAGSMPAPAAPVTTAQGQMVAHEQNGMVYYFDPSQIYAPVEGYPPASYTVPGMGGMMTPSPDGYYYPQMPQGGMVYYPTQ